MEIWPNEVCDNSTTITVLLQKVIYLFVIGALELERLKNAKFRQ